MQELEAALRNGNKSLVLALYRLRPRGKHHKLILKKKKLKGNQKALCNLSLILDQIQQVLICYLAIVE